MRVVADTNIIFSALLKKDSTELRILQFHAIEVYIPKFLMIELFKHKEKIVSLNAAGSHLIIQTRGIVERFGLETAGS